MRRGFSLIELMLVVCILGVLVAIVVPKVQAARLKAQRAEVRVNTAAIHSHLDLYVASDAGSEPLNSGFNPSPQPSALAVDGREARAWNTGVSDRQAEIWGRLGYTPDGAVLCSYQVYSAGALDAEDYWTLGDCDMDEHGFPLQRLVVGKGTARDHGLRRKGDDLFTAAY